MQKLGKLIKKRVQNKPFFHQVCFSHGLHLAVRDTFEGFCQSMGQVSPSAEKAGDEGDVNEIRKEISTWQIVEITTNANAHEDAEATGELIAMIPHPRFLESGNSIRPFFLPIPVAVERELIKEELIVGPPKILGFEGLLISKVRDVCRIFHKRAELSDELLKQAEAMGAQSHVKCVLDVKTRWYSTLRMLRNFMTLVDPIRRVYVENEMGPLPLSDSDLDDLGELIKTLRPVEKASERLSKPDMDLRKADLALQVSNRF